MVGPGGVRAALPAGPAGRRDGRPARPQAHPQALLPGRVRRGAWSFAGRQRIRLASTTLLVVAVVFGASRAFCGRPIRRLGRCWCRAELLPRSIAWNSLAGQTAGIVGPALGGVLVAVSPALAFWDLGALYICLGARDLRHPRDRRAGGPDRLALALVEEGWSMSGATRSSSARSRSTCSRCCSAAPTALLPVFARDVLHVGPAVSASCAPDRPSAPRPWRSDPGQPADPPSRRPDHVRRRRGLRPGDHRLRPVAGRCGCR